MTDYEEHGVPLSQTQHFPGCERGYLYAIEFDNGILKVGKSNRPLDRIPRHFASARRFDATPVKVYISRDFEWYADGERKMIAYARGLGESVDREVFKGVDFLRVVGYVDGMAEERTRDE